MNPKSSKPSKSGADTPRSSSFVQHGGKVDPDALLKRIREAKPSDSPDDFADTTEAVGPILNTQDVDQQISPTVDEDAPNRVVFVLQRDLDKRLDKYLTDRITFMSRTQLQRLIDAGDGVTVNGKRPKASTRLRAGDRVEVYVPPPPPTEIQAENIPLNIVYEDDMLIVINKSPDIIVHPARAHNKGTMLNALAWHFQHAGGALSDVGKEFARPGVIHRLDRQTSGLIVFGKSDEAHWRIGQQFERRTVDKRYLALVHGLYEPAIDVIDLPLGPHPSKEKGYREKYVVRHDVLGKHAVTIARVRRHFTGPTKDASATLLELELKTGRTHQIRVHLTHRGFPILADDMYTGKPLAGMTRVALHAATLQFKHPADGRQMSFQAALPPDLAAAVATLGNMDNLSTVQTPPGATVRLDGQT